MTQVRLLCGLVALSIAGCSRERPAKLSLGVSSPARFDYPKMDGEHAASGRRPATAERASADFAVNAGMLDTRRMNFERCGASVGWSNDEYFLSIDGRLTGRSNLACVAEPSLDDALRRSLDSDEALRRDAVTRALLLRAGADGSLLANDARSAADRWSAARAFAARMWSEALRHYSGRADGAHHADDGAARTTLTLARYAVGQFERTGASEAAVLAAFPFARWAKELDESRWLVDDRIANAHRGGGRALSIALSGWTSSRGGHGVAVLAPMSCAPEARRVRALRYRPTAEWFDASETAELLGDWRALEGLLQRLNAGQNLTRTILAPCADDEVERPARGYEVAYVMLAAALGFDALAPDEHARFVAGDARLLLEVEARFRERIQRSQSSRESLARVLLDQRATEVAWVSSAKSLVEYYQRRASSGDAAMAMQRNRDAARVLAAARNSAPSRWLQRCELLVAVARVDAELARQNATSDLEALLADAGAHGDQPSRRCAQEASAAFRGGEARRDGIDRSPLAVPADNGTPDSRGTASARATQTPATP